MGQEAEALKADIEHRRESMSGTIDAIEDKVVPSRIVERRRVAVSSWVGGMKERVMGSAHSATDQASSTVTQVRDGVNQAADAVSNAPAKVQDATAGSPLIAGAVAFGLGALLAALLPETEPEHRAVAAMEPQLTAAAGAVKDAGQQALETAKSSAQEAAQDLKESAAQHAHEVSDQARDAGEQLKGAAAETSR